MAQTWTEIRRKLSPEAEARIAASVLTASKKVLSAADSESSTAKRARLLQKLAYGWENNGTVVDNQQEQLVDTDTPLNHHETPLAPANTISDVEAEQDFPSLAQHVHRPPPPRWPAR